MTALEIIGAFALFIGIVLALLFTFGGATFTIEKTRN